MFCFESDAELFTSLCLFCLPQYNIEHICTGYCAGVVIGDWKSTTDIVTSELEIHIETDSTPPTDNYKPYDNYFGAGNTIGQS